MLSLLAIGCDAVADLARSAIEAVGINGAITASAIESAMDEEDPTRDARLAALDLRYYQLPEDLAEPLLTFKTNRDQITLP